MTSPRGDILREERPPRALRAGLLVLLLTALVPFLLERSLSYWWPAVGLVTALLLLTERRHHTVVAVGLGLALGAVALTVSDVLSPLSATLATVVVVVPAYAAARLLRPRPGGPRIRGFGTPRYHVVLLSVAVACGALVGTLVASYQGPAMGGYWFLTGTLGALTSLLVVLPLVVPGSNRVAAGSRPELWLQRSTFAATALLTPWSGVVLIVAFPVVAWAALRATRKESHLQMTAYSLVVYASAVTGAGPFAAATEAADLPDALLQAPLFVYLAALAYVMVPLSMSVERLSEALDDADRAASTLESMLDGANSTILIMVDPQGLITHFNQGAQRILGYLPEEVLGETPARFHSPEDVARLAEELGVEPVLREVTDVQVRDGLRLDHEMVCKDGTRRNVSLSIAAVRDTSGAVVGFIASGDDVTERLRAQEALVTALDHEHRSVRRLQEVDHVKQELVSNVSHELRTPITSIAGYAELLSDDSLGELTRPQRDALQRIERNALRLQSLVDDLLTLSRAEGGQLQLNRTLVDLRLVVTTAWEIFEEQLRRRELTATLRVTEDAVSVLGDRDALERVVVNLVSNAVKFTPDGGSVEVTLTRREGTALLIVRDTGIGIDEAEQEQLFTRFFRSTQATDAAIQGTGLGLSIVQALVSQHGGQVAVRSQVGQGTRITVELPTT